MSENSLPYDPFVDALDRSYAAVDRYGSFFAARRASKKIKLAGEAAAGWDASIPVLECYAAVPLDAAYESRVTSILAIPPEELDAYAYRYWLTNNPENVTVMPGADGNADLRAHTMERPIVCRVTKPWLCAAYLEGTYDVDRINSVARQLLREVPKKSERVRLSKEGQDFTKALQAIVLRSVVALRDGRPDLGSIPDTISSSVADHPERNYVVFQTSRALGKLLNHEYLVDARYRSTVREVPQSCTLEAITVYDQAGLTEERLWAGEVLRAPGTQTEKAFVDAIHSKFFGESVQPLSQKSIQQARNGMPPAEYLQTVLEGFAENPCRYLPRVFDFSKEIRSGTPSGEAYEAWLVRTSNRTAAGANSKFRRQDRGEHVLPLFESIIQAPWTQAYWRILSATEETRAPLGVRASQAAQDIKHAEIAGFLMGSRSPKGVQNKEVNFRLSIDPANIAFRFPDLSDADVDLVHKYIVASSLPTAEALPVAIESIL